MKEPNPELFLDAVTPSTMQEATTIHYALQAFMQECGRKKEAGEEYDGARWRIAEEMFRRSFAALGLTMIETASPSRVVAVMQGEPDPGEPKKDKPS